MKACAMNDGMDLCLTVYNNDFGLVTERRSLDLTEQDQQLQYLDVAAKMDVASLRVEGVAVVDVNFNGPELVLQLQPAVAREIGLSYLTEGLGWRVNYLVGLGEKNLTLDAWVEISNETGLTFNNVRLKLLAGTVNRIDERSMNLIRDGAKPYLLEKAAFTEKSFSGYHLYTLPGTTTLKNGQLKQIRLFGATNISYDRYYEIAAGSEDVRMVFELCNDLESGLGMPFPAGTVKFYQSDPCDQGLTFVGEDQIDHTPRGEKIRLVIGEAFDLSCSRKCLSKRNDRGISKETWQIMIGNHKEVAVLVHVLHRVAATAEVEKISHYWERGDADEIRILADVAAGQTEVIEFTTLTDERLHVESHHRPPIQTSYIRM